MPSLRSSTVSDAKAKPLLAKKPSNSVAVQSASVAIATTPRARIVVARLRRQRPRHALVPLIRRDPDRFQRALRRGAAELTFIEPREGEADQPPVPLGGEGDEGVRLTLEMGEPLGVKGAAGAAHHAAVDRHHVVQVAAVQRPDDEVGRGWFATHDVSSCICSNDCFSDAACRVACARGYAITIQA